jgi:hypothetical protein
MAKLVTLKTLRPANFARKSWQRKLNESWRALRGRGSDKEGWSEKKERMMKHEVGGGAA